MNQGESPDILRITREDLEVAARSPRDRKVTRNHNVMATLSLVLGIVSVFFAGLAVGPVAIVCGIVAAKRATRDSDRPNRKAFFGIVLGIVGCLVWALVVWYVLSTRSLLPEPADEPQPTEQVVQATCARDRRS